MRRLISLLTLCLTLGLLTGCAAQNTDLPVRLFVSAGELEKNLARAVEEFTQTLGKRNYPGLEMETRIIAGEGHASNKPEAFNRGLRFVFQR